MSAFKEFNIEIASGRHDFENNYMPSIRLLLVDDHEAVRRGVRLVLAGNPNIEVVGEATNGEEAVEKATELRPRSSS